MTICHVCKKEDVNNVRAFLTFPARNACGVYYFVTFVALQHTGLSLVRQGREESPGNTEHHIS